MSNPTRPDWEADYRHWINAGCAPATQRAYIRDVRYFWDWVTLHLGAPCHYPATPEIVLPFCLYHLAPDSPHPLKVATLRRYLAALSIAHHDQGVPSPTTHPRVKLLLKRAKAARKEVPVCKHAITLKILQQLIGTCDHSLSGQRDRALLLVGFYSGGRRREELSQLAVHDLIPTAHGYQLTVRARKNNPASPHLVVPITGSTATAVKAWLLASGIRAGELFRGIKPNNTLYPALSGTSINTMVKQRIHQIGLDPSVFGVHSLRAGFITESVHHGLSIHEVMQYSGHRDIVTAQKYIRRPTLK